MATGWKSVHRVGQDCPEQTNADTVSVDKEADYVVDYLTESQKNIWRNVIFPSPVWSADILSADAPCV